MSNAFLIDRTGSASLTYEDLLARLSGGEYAPVFRPSSTAEALVAVLTALVRGAPLRLVDSDFS
ncbi:long-chain fatty acid--CoA ligase, partial [bacterium]|nr:long-chain fatty acid--CoA ligase [bacterium]